MQTRRFHIINSIMPQETQKIQGKFYPLTASELIKLCSMLTDAELKALLYLKALHPFTDSYKELDTSQMAEHLNISRRSVQRFLKKFKSLELIKYELTRFKYKTTPESPTQEEATPGSPKRHQDRLSDPRIAETTPGSPKRHQDHFESPNRPPQAAPSSPQTLQTIQTNQTFSEDPRTTYSCTTESSEKKPACETVSEKDDSGQQNKLSPTHSSLAPTQSDTEQHKINHRPTKTTQDLNSQPQDLGEDQTVTAACSIPVTQKLPVHQYDGGRQVGYRTNNAIRTCNEIPDGPWKLEDGTVEPNFLDAIAGQWQHEYKDDIHTARWKVQQHLKKANNAQLLWEQYQGRKLENTAPKPKNVMHEEIEARRERMLSEWEEKHG